MVVRVQGDQQPTRLYHRGVIEKRTSQFDSLGCTPQGVGECRKFHHQIRKGVGVTVAMRSGLVLQYSLVVCDESGHTKFPYNHRVRR